MRTENILTIACVVGIIYLVMNRKENFSTCQAKKHNQIKTNKPDDLFNDGLDHPYGIKKRNRHHSF